MTLEVKREISYSNMQISVPVTFRSGKMFILA